MILLKYVRFFTSNRNDVNYLLLLQINKYLPKYAINLEAQVTHDYFVSREYYDNTGYGVSSPRQKKIVRFWHKNESVSF